MLRVPVFTVRVRADRLTMTARAVRISAMTAKVVRVFAAMVRAVRSAAKAASVVRRASDSRNRTVTTVCIPTVNNKRIVSNTKIRRSRYV